MPSSQLRVWPYFRRAIQPSLLLIAVGVLIRLLSDTAAPRQFGGLLALTGLGCTALTLLVFALLHWRRQL